jgi:hypothetical protein
MYTIGIIAAAQFKLKEIVADGVERQTRRGTAHRMLALKSGPVVGVQQIAFAQRLSVPPTISWTRVRG